jgi:hypothetical protein
MKLFGREILTNATIAINKNGAIYIFLCDKEKIVPNNEGWCLTTNCEFYLIGFSNNDMSETWLDSKRDINLESLETLAEKSCRECDSECPFSFENTLSGVCLPTAPELVTLKLIYDVNWACHSDSTKPCVGLIRTLKDAGLNHKVNKAIPLYTLEDWNDNSFDKFPDFNTNVERAYSILTKARFEKGV